MTRYWLFAMLFLALTSCNKEVEEELPWECLPCGSYTGTYSSVISSAISPSIDTSVINAPTSVIISENQDSTIQIKFDISSLLGASPATLELTISEVEWSNLVLSGSVEPPSQHMSTLFQIQATCSSNYQNLMGYVIISRGAQGNLTFNVSQL